MTVSPRSSSAPLTRSSACSEPDSSKISSAVQSIAGIALELLDEELAQRPVALRAGVQAVVRQPAALARQHRLRGLLQVVDGQAIRIVIAEGEVVFRRPVHLTAGAGEPAATSGAKSNA